MSTKVGVIAEGAVDRALLAALLERIARDRADYDWPVDTDDMTEVFLIRKRGHGGVLETVRRLVSVLDTQLFDHAFFVILLDRRTRAAQKKVRKLLLSRDRFVLAVAIQEIEAWWLGDRGNTLAWAGIANLPEDARYAVEQYQAERDNDPKKTLDELTRISDRFDRYYGDGDAEMASDFAENYWRGYAKLDAIRTQCPKGYGAFENVAANRFRSAKALAGRLF